ncbi:ethanolamine ammonia-lyase subunit EutC [Gallaecimonas xiamenensis]|uniref:Ethanolamine ammonia-lyase small subunit n=1 Tax=Gallaecimonas xiamenensis 3-C-1 TaxID=745411 RepID=K2KED3_9GAMM|nr:ethanolamine ammonia-lyase subunit EutC [Gallaecimonas xiamenensis]EKE75645.1 ethanolamine ammonia-lyase small subunit [Gallaecimonas xiamenensis 3-C-1]
MSDPWRQLRHFTAARIAQGKAGVSLPTQEHLRFQLDHARARDAVHRALDLEKLKAQLPTAPLLLASQAKDRAQYLQRPDWGRRLDEASAEALRQQQGDFDLALVIADGLSALAVEENAGPFLQALLPQLRDWSLAPLCLVKQGRVAIGDEVATLLGARMVLVLIGERPGLSATDSLGLYFTYGPRVGCTDERRNCISNVRPAGLSYPEAARRQLYLLQEAWRRGLSGVELKDESPMALAGPGNFLLP